MQEVQRIEDQLRRSFEGEAWHGPPLGTLLATVSAAQATARPLRSAHSIWEIALHLGFWHDVVRRRIEGQAVPASPADKDWPTPAAPSPEAWAAVCSELAAGHRRLRSVVLSLDDSRLDDIVAPGSETTIYRLLHGIAQHDLYHAGQIAILAKITG